GGHSFPISVAGQSNIAHGKSLFATLPIMPTYMETLRRKGLNNWMPLSIAEHVWIGSNASPSALTDHESQYSSVQLMVGCLCLLLDTFGLVPMPAQVIVPALCLDDKESEIVQKFWEEYNTLESIMKETRLQMAISDLKYAVGKSEEATVHSNVIGERRYNILQNSPFSGHSMKRKGSEFLDLEDPTAPLFDNNSSKKSCYKKNGDEKELGRITVKSNETIEDVLASQIDNEEKMELTNEDFEERLNDADIINITTAQSQSLPRINVDGLKEWIKKNYARKIKTTLSNLRSTTIIEGFDAEHSDFIKRIFEIKLMQLQAGHGEKLDWLMDENTYTSTIVSPDFEILNLTNALLNRNENEVPSSKWRRILIYGVASARKADGILFNYDNVDQEFLIFENIGPPSRRKKPKYYADLLKCFRNSVDAICKIFWNGNGDVELVRKYYVLAYVLHGKKGELFRLNLGAPKTFVAEKILVVNYPFEYATFPNIVDIIDLLFTVKAVFESNQDVFHDYTKSCMETTKKFTPVREWLHLNRDSF
ncbi:22994_t:CDS:10, partial [Gigaspora margarita]